MKITESLVKKILHSYHCGTKKNQFLLKPRYGNA